MCETAKETCHTSQSGAIVYVTAGGTATQLPHPKRIRLQFSREYRDNISLRELCFVWDSGVRVEEEVVEVVAGAHLQP